MYQLKIGIGLQKQLYWLSDDCLKTPKIRANFILSIKISSKKCVKTASCMKKKVQQLIYHLEGLLMKNVKI